MRRLTIATLGALAVCLGLPASPVRAAQVHIPEFQEVDADADGKASQEEIGKAVEQSKIVKEWDVDQNDGLDPNELSDGLFDALDKDSNAKINTEEMRELEELVGDAVPGFRQEDQPVRDALDEIGEIGTEEQAEGLTRATFGQRIRLLHQHWDENRDDKLTAEELGAGIFKTFDLYGNGEVTEAEYTDGRRAFGLEKREQRTSEEDKKADQDVSDEDKPDQDVSDDENKPEQDVSDEDKPDQDVSDDENKPETPR